MTIIVWGRDRVGKTTLGSRIASHLGYTHIRTSEPLRFFFGMSVDEFERQKEDPEFRQLLVLLTDTIRKKWGAGAYMDIVWRHVPKPFRRTAVISGVRYYDEVRHLACNLAPNPIVVGVGFNENAASIFNGIPFFPIRQYPPEDEVKRLLAALDSLLET